MRNLILLITMFVTLASCNSKKNKQPGILKKEKMEAVLWDVLRADAFAFYFIIKDSLKKPDAEMAKLQQQIFAIHKTSREEFYKSFDYYRAHPDIMQPLLDSMITKYTRDKYVNTKGDGKPVADTIKAQ